MPKIRHSKQFEFCIFTNLAILVKLMILVNLVNLVNLVKLELESSGIARKREGGYFVHGFPNTLRWQCLWTLMEHP